MADRRAYGAERARRLDSPSTHPEGQAGGSDHEEARGGTPSGQALPTPSNHPGGPGDCPTWTGRSEALEHHPESEVQRTRRLRSYEGIPFEEIVVLEIPDAEDSECKPIVSQPYKEVADGVLRRQANIARNSGRDTLDSLYLGNNRGPLSLADYTTTIFDDERSGNKKLSIQEIRALETISPIEQATQIAQTLIQWGWRPNEQKLINLLRVLEKDRGEEPDAEDEETTPDGSIGEDETDWPL